MRELAAREAQRAVPFPVQVGRLTLSIRPALSPLSNQLDLRRFCCVFEQFSRLSSLPDQLVISALSDPEIRPIRAVTVFFLCFR